MPSTADLIIDETIIVLVFAKFKVGKTWGALTFPRPNVIDFDGGIRTLLNPDFVKKYGVKHVEYFQPRRELDTKGVPKNYNAFDEACKYFDKWMAAGYRDRFDTWVLDSCTTLIDAASDKAILLLGSKDFKGAGSSTFAEAQKHGLVSPKMQDYGAERSMTEQFVRMIKESGKHCVVLCHERELMDKDGTPIAIVPLLTGKSQEDIPIMFHEVYRLTAKPKGEDMVRALQTQPSVVSSLARVGSRIGVADGTEWTYDAISKQLHDLNAAAKAASATAGSPSTLPQAPAKAVA